MSARIRIWLGSRHAQTRAWMWPGPGLGHGLDPGPDIAWHSPKLDPDTALRSQDLDSNMTLLDSNIDGSTWPGPDLGSGNKNKNKNASIAFF